MGALSSNAKIINISYGSSLIGIHNPMFHPVLHKFFKYFHDKQGGLIFLSAGNDGIDDTLNKNLPYLIMVSAIDQTGTLSKFAKGGSNYGPYVDFTAPGSNIVVSDIDGTPTTVSGTSFSAPIVAGVASLVWGARPKLTNDQVEWCLAASCVNTTPGQKNVFYGWGMPDAERALKIALGMKN
jgi:subtilisin family serine protease